MSDATAELVTPPSAPARENIGRGALAALITVPVGIAAWVVVWSFGYVAAIVGFVVAFLALRLYVWGAGRISRAGAAIVLLITVVTLGLAFLAGIVYDAALSFGDASELGTWGALTHPDFWPVFAEILPVAFPDYLPDLGWALGFGALGSFATLRAAFSTPATPDAPQTAPGVGSSPAADPQATTGQV